MTDDVTYTPEQALARDVLLAAVNGASNHWAHVHGYTVDCPPEQVRAEGINTTNRSVWIVDLDDITRAITKLIERPLACGDPNIILDTGLLFSISATLAMARTRQLTRVANLPAPDAGLPDYDRGNFERMLTDVVFQVAVADEVIY